MDMRIVVKSVLPRPVVDRLRRRYRAWQMHRRERLPRLSEQDFRRLLSEDLGLRHGDVAFVHSSLHHLNLAFSSFQVLDLLREIVGPEGTLLFPTYSKMASYEFLHSGEVFDVKRSSSYTGILTELARRQPGALRSLHPTKSVCAIGPAASHLTADHHGSPYPYDRCSPYYRVVAARGKVVGLGISSKCLSLMHCVDDVLRNHFPVAPYHDKVFAAPCIDWNDQPVVVRTLAHDAAKMRHDVSNFLRRNIAPAIARDFVIQGMQFFRAEAQPLFDAACRLARRGITIYSRTVYTHEEPIPELDVRPLSKRLH